MAAHSISSADSDNATAVGTICRESERKHSIQWIRVNSLFLKPYGGHGFEGFCGSVLMRMRCAAHGANSSSKEPSSASSWSDVLRSHEPGLAPTSQTLGPALSCLQNVQSTNQLPSSIDLHTSMQKTSPAKQTTDDISLWVRRPVGVLLESLPNLLAAHAVVVREHYTVAANPCRLASAILIRENVEAVIPFWIRHGNPDWPCQGNSCRPFTAEARWGSVAT